MPKDIKIYVDGKQVTISPVDIDKLKENKRLYVKNLNNKRILLWVEEGIVYAMINSSKNVVLDPHDPNIKALYDSLRSERMAVA